MPEITVWVGNLPYSWRTPELLQFTNTQNGNVMIDERLRSLGWGWVIVTSTEELARLLKFNGYVISEPILKDNQASRKDLVLRICEWNNRKKSIKKEINNVNAN